MTQLNDDLDLEKEITRQERIVEMEALKLQGLLTQRDMRQFTRAQDRVRPRL